MKANKIVRSERGKLAVYSLFIGIVSIAWPFVVGYDLLPWYVSSRNAFAYVVMPGGGLIIGLLLRKSGLESERKVWAMLGTRVCVIGLILWVPYSYYWYVQTHL